MSEPTPPDEAKDFYIKYIMFDTQRLPIVTQNRNGPCSLIAIMNVLLLKQKVNLAPNLETISSEQLINCLGDYIFNHIPQNLSEMSTFEKNLADSMNIIYKLQTGLDVNVKFTGVADFEYTPEIILFDILEMSLYHGWLIDPLDKDTVNAVNSHSYNDLVVNIICQRESDIEENVRQALIADTFLRNTASQLTEHGLNELKRIIPEKELSVLFRNNHFSTLYKQNNKLFLLVTDQGLINEPNIVWQELDHVHGDCPFTDAGFSRYTQRSPSSSSIHDQFVPARGTQEIYNDISNKQDTKTSSRASSRKRDTNREVFPVSKRLKTVEPSNSDGDKKNLYCHNCTKRKIISLQFPLQRQGPQDKDYVLNLNVNLSNVTDSRSTLLPYDRRPLPIGGVYDCRSEAGLFSAGSPSLHDDSKDKKCPSHLDHVDTQFDDKPTRALYVGNLGSEITEYELKTVFSRFGMLKTVLIKRPSHGNAYAFVKYINLYFAHKAKVEMSGTYIGRLQCTIQYVKVPPTNVLWVGGLGPWVTVEILKSEFDRFGGIKRIEWPQNKKFAYIIFDGIAPAQAACQQMRGFPLGAPERRLHTDFGEENEITPSYSLPDHHFCPENSDTLPDPRRGPPIDVSYQNFNDCLQVDIDYRPPPTVSLGIRHNHDDDLYGHNPERDYRQGTPAKSKSHSKEQSPERSSDEKNDRAQSRDNDASVSERSHNHAP